MSSAGRVVAEISAKLGPVPSKEIAETLQGEWTSSAAAGFAKFAPSTAEELQVKQATSIYAPFGGIASLLAINSGCRVFLPILR